MQLHRAALRVDLSVLVPKEAVAADPLKNLLTARLSPCPESGMIPGALDDLAPEERHRVYKMLRLRILVHLDGTLEVSGAFGGGLELCENGSTWGSGVSSVRP